MDVSAAQAKPHPLQPDSDSLQEVEELENWSSAQVVAWASKLPEPLDGAELAEIFELLGTNGEQLARLTVQDIVEAEEEIGISQSDAEMLVDAVRQEVESQQPSQQPTEAVPEPEADVRTECIGPGTQTHKTGDKDAGSSVIGWLRECHLERYWQAFEEQGYDNLRFLQDAEPEDIEELIAAASMKKPHSVTFQKALAQLQNGGCNG